MVTKGRKGATGTSMKIERVGTWKPRRKLPEPLTPMQKQLLIGINRGMFPRVLPKWNIDGYVVDFAFRKAKVAVYVRELKDVSKERIQTLEEHGYTVLVFPPQSVKNNLDTVLGTLREHVGWG